MSALQPIAITSLADEALSKIVQAITGGEFKPGERLSEAELARQLGISRGPLREALGRLEGRLVVRTPRIGVSVMRISRRDLIQLFAVREALEGMASRLAAERLSRRDLKALEDLLAQHRQNPRVLSLQGYYQRTGDEDFHLQILRCADNQRLEEALMDGLYYQLRLYRFQASTQPGRAQQAYEEHREVVAALATGDGEAAEDRMRRHIRNACASMLASLPEEQEDEPEPTPSPRAAANGQARRPPGI